MNVAIVGYATEGQVSYEYYTKRGHTVTICDRDPNKIVPAGALAQLGEQYLDNLARFDVVVRSAGIRPDILTDKNPGIENKITTAVDEFLRACPTKNTIGITGTKGKGTTSTLTAKILEAAGFKVFLAGNIGNSPLEIIDQVQPGDFVVLELSSFQLTDLKHATHTSCCLMVVPEHLDWHPDLDAYLLSKARLFEYQASGDTAIFFAKSEDSRKIVSYSPGLKIPYFAEPGAHVVNEQIVIAGDVVCNVHDLKLLGEHNWQNACAAVTICWQFTQNVSAMRQVLTTFAGLEHRLEFVRELQGVKYYDDSFGTTPETAMVAVKALKQPKVLILGGSVKGTSFKELGTTIAHQNVRAIVLIGNTTHPHYKTAAPEVQAALEDAGVMNITSLVKPGGPTMAEIVQTARQLAQPGDAVLLSTACASFDIFTDYKDRGNQFKAIVQALV